MANPTLKTTAQIEARRKYAEGRLTTNFGLSGDEELLAEITTLVHVVDETREQVQERLDSASQKLSSEEKSVNRAVLTEEVEVLEWVLGERELVRK